MRACRHSVDACVLMILSIFADRPHGLWTEFADRERSADGYADGYAVCFVMRLSTWDSVWRRRPWPAER